jgi:Ca-activated chloride channel family protein
MSFAAPLVLLALLALPLLITWYTGQQRRRAVAASAFVTPALTASVVPRRPRWRRHVPMLVFALAIAALIAAAARPQRSVAVPVTNGAIMLADDVSSSMRATDVSPSRLAAAEAAAKRFLAKVPGPVPYYRSQSDRECVHPAQDERRHGRRCHYQHRGE